MKSFGLTDRGLVRQINEDELFRSDTPIGCLPNLYIVADGMGGHNAGDVASKNCTRYLIDYIEQAEIDSDIESLFKDAIDYANRKVFEEGVGDQSLSGMGTTLVVTTIYKNDVYIANVGDSRLYTMGAYLRQVTIDHSVVEELYRAGQITEVEKNHHPDRNMITRAIGVEGQIKADFFAVSSEETRYVMLCTDGLTKMVSDVEIEQQFNEVKSHQDIALKLKDLAIRHGGNDNITIIVIDLESQVVL